ncbi:MAG: DEAD/DEAH box helicase [Chitinivibrionales bacterium]|nr:DEAD/DEAH box helicase [Chitinivibrionales bacterium]
MLNTAEFLERLKRLPFFENQIVHVNTIPEREPVYGDLDGGMDSAVFAALQKRGVIRLYSHQAEAVGQVRKGNNVVVVTATASGKTLCYTIPVVESIRSDSSATMLFLYPTKALAQDQLRGLSSLQESESDISFIAGTYDGDTPANLRRKLRDSAHIILSNPDMLHQGILPQHARWNRFFTHLRYIVIDEIHAYRGIFGSHLSNVMRRLRRICAHYGSSPQFICSSATIANPGEHAERICGVPMKLVDNDGSPRGSKQFVLWNPPPLKTAATGDNTNWRAGGDRRSPVGDAVSLITTLVKERVQTIAFVRTRLAAELIYKSCRDRLMPVSRKLAESVHAYRGGYLPKERREIERKLAAKKIMAVASTSALELGIDIGSLDVCILVGYPGTIASLWQRSGRAGRGRGESMVFLMGQNAPMDQYLMTYSDYLFKQNPEHAVVDADNPHIVVGHLKCAANELPLSDENTEVFGPYAQPVLELLEEDNEVSHIDKNWYWSTSEYPAASVNLRNIAGPVYTIQEQAENERIIGTLDEISALSQLHDHAVYLHGADTYFVNKLDIHRKIAFVERKDLDYYTQAVTVSQIQLDSKEIEEPWHDGVLGFGEVTVTTTTPMFKKIKFHSRDSLGFEKLELPPQSLETVAFWFAPPQRVVDLMLKKRLLVGEALIGIANVLVEVAPFFVMCDQQDIGTVVDARNLNRDALFFHDKYPGGMGYARRCLEQFDDIITTIRDVIANCACDDGCPSCVGSAVPQTAMTDMDNAVRGRIPNKGAAGFMLDFILKKGKFR